MKEKLKFLFYGILMGAANVIPGVSGGTIAIILNFYDRLMAAISLDLKKLKKNLPFLIPLAIGLGVGILGVAKLMELVLEYFPSETYFAFIGVVLGSLPLILYKAKNGKNKLHSTSWLVFAAMFVLMAVLSFIKPESGGVRYTTLSAESFVMCFISLAIGAMTMIVPGISGSLVMIMIGMYETIIVEIIGHFNIPLLIPSGLGACFGFLFGAKLISWLLKKYAEMTYLGILGLLAGSIIQLFINADIFGKGPGTVIFSLLAMAIMWGIVYFFSRHEIKGGNKE